MKKIFGIALVLAVLAVLSFGSVALADPDVTVNWDITGNAHINVSSHGSDNSHSGHAWFGLNGTGHSSGSVSADSTSVSGGYDGDNGDFSSSFGAYVGSDSFVYSEQSIQATGVTGSSLHVGGDANFDLSNFYLTGAGQEFNGEAETATIDATRVHGCTEITYGSFHAEITAGSTCQFGGSTEGRGYSNPEDPQIHSDAIMTGGETRGYTQEDMEDNNQGDNDERIYPDPGDNIYVDTYSGSGDLAHVSIGLNPDRVRVYTTQAMADADPGNTGASESYGGDMFYFAPESTKQQGLGFAVFATGTSLASSLDSNYAYNVIDGFVNGGVGVVGETSTWAEADGYPNYPDYYEP